jgi:hypothetical protein
LNIEILWNIEKTSGRRYASQARRNIETHGNSLSVNIDFGVLT